MNSRLKYFIVSTSSCLVVLLLLGTMLGRSASPEDAYKHLSVYTEVLSKIKSDYVEEPDMKNVTLGAVNGLLEAIDPYASYLNADQYKQWLKSKDQHKAAVGLVLSKKFGYIAVVDAIPGSPAEKAGLNTGDVLEAIKGVSTRDMPLAFADLLLEGDPGSTIELSVLRVRKPEPQKITLTRAAVKYPAVSSKMLPDGIGYVQAQSLEPGKVKDVARALGELEKQGAKKLMLDLRNSSTGHPEEGVALANLFLDKGLITYLQGQRLSRQDFQADPSKTVAKVPLVVLTNRGTTAAAEVAAAALQENGRAEVVGERTYGDAAVRKPITMEDGSAVILSVAKYYSPKGKAIQDTGVTPSVAVQDVEPVAESDDDNAPERPENPERKPGDDPVLKKGIEVLTGAVKPAAQPVAKDQEQKPGQRNVPPLTIK